MADLAVWQRTIVDEEGNVIPGAEIEVRREEDDSLATLYADRAGETPLANPLAADMSGFVRFFAQGDAYTITAVGAGSTRTWRFDPTGRLQEFDRISEALALGDAVEVGNRIGVPLQINYGDQFQEPDLRYTAWPFAGLHYDATRNRVVQFYTAGSGHATPDHAVFMREVQWVDGLPRFGPRQLVVSYPDQGCTTHGSTVTPDGHYLVAVRVKDEDWNNVDYRMLRSTDGGVTWTDEQWLDTSNDPAFPVPSANGQIGSFLATSDGRYLAHMMRDGLSYILRSSDRNGANGTWQRQQIFRNYGSNGLEGCLYECRDGTIVNVMRTGLADAAPSYAISPDGGFTWTSAEATNATYSWQGPVAIVRRPGSIMLDVFSSSRRDFGDRKGRLFHATITEEQLKVGDLGKPRVISYGIADRDFGYVAACYDAAERLYMTFYDGSAEWTSIYLMHGQAGVAGQVDGSASARRDITAPLQGTSLFTVGAGGDFPTLTDALKFISRAPAIIYTGRRTRQTIRILDGTILAEQIHITGGLDFGHVNIVAENDAVIDVDFSAFTTTYFAADYGPSSAPFIGVAKGATAPRISARFRAVGTAPTDYNDFITVFGAGSSLEFGSGADLDGNGVVRRCLNISDGAQVTGRNLLMGGGNSVIYAQQSTVILPGLTLYDAAAAPIIVDRATVILPDLTVNDGNGSLVIRNQSKADLDRLTYPNAPGDTLSVEGGSEVFCDSGDLSGSGGNAVLATRGSRVSVIDSDLSGAAQSGARARQSWLNVSGSNCRKGASDDPADITCLDGGTIIAHGAVGGTNFNRNTINSSGNGMILGAAP